jgi:hypothetical protein
LKYKLKKRYIVLICLLVVCIGRIIFYYATTSPFYRFVKTNVKNCKGEWKLEGASIVFDNHIVVSFFNKKSDWNMSEIAFICKELLPEIRDYYGSDYDGYDIDFHFKSYAGKRLAVQYSDGDKFLTITANRLSRGVCLENIVMNFPEVNSLQLDDSVRCKYLDCLKDVKDLKYIEIGNPFSEEKQDYILTLFPDCKFKEGDNSNIGRTEE